MLTPFDSEEDPCVVYRRGFNYRPPHFYARWRWVGRYPQWVADHLFHDALTSLAGPCAEDAYHDHAGDWRDQKPDLRNAEHSLQCLHVLTGMPVDDETIGEAREHAFLRTQCLVHEHWEAIIVMAEALLEKRELDGDDIAQIVRCGRY